MNTVIVEAEVLDFIEDVKNDDLDIGGITLYNASKVKILNSTVVGNRTLMIFHQKQILLNEKWKQKGSVIKFRINEIFLMNNYLIFSPGLMDVEFF